MQPWDAQGQSETESGRCSLLLGSDRPRSAPAAKSPGTSERSSLRRPFVASSLATASSALISNCQQNTISFEMAKS